MVVLASYYEWCCDPDHRRCIVLRPTRPNPVAACLQHLLAYQGVREGYSSNSLAASCSLQRLPLNEGGDRGILHYSSFSSKRTIYQCFPCVYPSDTVSAEDRAPSVFYGCHEKPTKTMSIPTSWIFCSKSKTVLEACEKRIPTHELPLRANAFGFF